MDAQLQLERAFITHNYEEISRLLREESNKLKNYKTMEFVLLSKRFDLLFICFWLDYPMFDPFCFKTALMAGNHDCIRFMLSHLIPTQDGKLEEEIIKFVVNLGDQFIADDIIHSNVNTSKVNPTIMNSFRQLLENSGDNESEPLRKKRKTEKIEKLIN